MTATCSCDSIKLARSIRQSAIQMLHRAKASHLGSCLSIADVLAVLYGGWLKVDPHRPNWSDRDRFILSKGHAGAAVFATLAHSGFFPLSELDTYCQEGSHLNGHISHHVPGVEASSGSLGHGLPLAVGMALAARTDKRPSRAVVLLGDGECDEGSIWEAALFAPHHQLNNLIAIVDFNKIQSFGSVKEVLNLDPLADKWKAFNWAVKEIDGHDHSQIRQALDQTTHETSRPSVIIAHTIKGKGVSFMENQLAWHYKSPDAEQMAKALAELESKS